MKIKVVAFDKNDKEVRKTSEEIKGLEKLEDLEKDEISTKIKTALEKLFCSLNEAKIEDYTGKNEIKITFKGNECKVGADKDSYYILYLENEKIKEKVENILKRITKK